MDEASKIHDRITVRDAVTVRSRAHFSIQHVLSAAYFARQALEVERNYFGVYDAAMINAHRASVTGAILMSVSFLEAAINEFFADTVDNPYGTVKDLDPDLRSLLAEMWAMKVPRTSKYSILEKYDIALTLMRRAPFDKGTSPYQEVSILVQLRNVMVHYEPEWITGYSTNPGAKVTEHKFQKSLQGRFPLNPLTSANNPFFPDQCFSHGCAAWAVESTVSFADAFFARMGLAAPYDHVRDQLGVN